MALEKIVSPDRTIPVTQKGMMENRFANWTENVTRWITTAVIEGDGTPEGSVNARRLTLYFDTTNDVLYIKKTDSGSSTGWVQV
jgi:hypothetical protein